MKRLILSTTLLAAVGCYRSVPIEPSATVPGREVVVVLTPRGSLELAPLLGAQVNSVSGRLVDVTPTAFRLSVSSTSARGGMETLWKGETADVLREYAAAVSERRIDKKRSWIVAGLTVLGVMVAGEAFGINTGLDGFITGGGRGSKQ
ncbi:MAG: hypothetical protein JNJ98_19080 [Gemmatimonadetes bacterium]|nr:hypothetical protein [Gemmatimonadota bacterium]